uniref:Uncharacterized protein n=1 Tax=Arundo donax TaxID=35708 RepID=A0A0A9B1N6_ARUDO
MWLAKKTYGLQLTPVVYCDVVCMPLNRGYVPNSTGYAWSGLNLCHDMLCSSYGAGAVVHGQHVGYFHLLSICT